MQGFNMGRYYPPDAENAPRFNTSHPLGARARKINQGILTVRFELPFAVWCTHCQPPAIVGQGVRFNAEKKKVGNYYSTPIWSFRMKHTACGGWWEIRTDPQHAEYVVVEGARRREDGSAKAGEEAEGELKFLTEEERERRKADAFAGLEGRLEEKGREERAKERVEELYERSEVWRDPYDVNARLRRDFRAQRKALQRGEREKEDMQERFGLGIEIADETEADRVRAGLVEFGAVPAVHGDDVDAVARKPLFAANESSAATGAGSSTKKLKSEIKAEKSRQNLQQALVGNTRAAMDPFLAADSTKPASKLNLGIRKRKREGKTPVAQPDDGLAEKPPASEPTTQESALKNPMLAAALVDYDSD